MNVVKKYTETSLVLRIVVGLVIGAVMAILCPGAKFIGIFGTVFVSALKAIAPILVAIIVMSSISGAKGGMGSRFRMVIVLYLLSTIVAAEVAVIGSFIFPVSITLRDAAATAEAPAGLADVLRNLLAGAVSNPVAAVGQGNYLAVLFWAVLLGLALKKVASPNTLGVISELADATSTVVKWVIQFAPFGIMGLVFLSVADGGLDIFAEYGRIILLLVGCMLFNVLVVTPVIVAVMLHRNPYPLVFRCLKESGIPAFFTRSSAANIPVNMDLCKRMGLDNQFYSVSIPLGSTINMNGAAVTITVMTMAICNTLGIEVGFASAILLSVMAAFAACGSSGVAGGSLLLIPMACSLFGIGPDIAMQGVAVGFIIGVIQDSVETALNSSGDVIFTATAELYEERRKAQKSE